MKISELKTLSSSDLTQKEKVFKKELFDLNNLKKVGQVEKPSRFRALKKDIARIMTILRERELDNGRNTTKTK